MSYGGSVTEAYRQAGDFSPVSSRARTPQTCRFRKPKFELIINLKTAKVLDLHWSRIRFR